MAYADYDFYVNEYKGAAMPEPDFDRLARQASAKIDAVTYDRIPAEWQTDKPLAIRIKMACCAAAEEYRRQEQGGDVVSESVGPWSKTYAASGKTSEQSLYDAVAMYLGNTGLMYRGCDPCSHIR